MALLTMNVRGGCSWGEAVKMRQDEGKKLKKIGDWGLRLGLSPGVFEVNWALGVLRSIEK